MLNVAISGLDSGPCWILYICWRKLHAGVMAGVRVVGTEKGIGEPISNFGWGCLYLFWERHESVFSLARGKIVGHSHFNGQPV